LALLATGRAFGWGGDGSGRMASRTPEYCSTGPAPKRPVELSVPHTLTALAAGYGASLGITGAGGVVMWGASAARVDRPLPPSALAMPQAVSGVGSARAVVAGDCLYAALAVDGTVCTWGLNDQGSLGRATPQLNSGPGPVALDAHVVGIAIGRGSMLALSDDGRVHAWGCNAAGQLGVGTLETETRPSVLGLTKIRSIAAGATHALAVTDEGALLGWGSNHRGQLGVAGIAYSPLPIAIAVPEPVRDIAAGMHFSLALGASGRVYAWGWNAAAQLGLGDTVDRERPTPITGLGPAQRIAAGETHAVALASDELFGWGNNSSGQIGSAAARQLRPAPLLP
jgi:alpha-tubulin suppressor-like RCC1 family protein